MFETKPKPLEIEYKTQKKPFTLKPEVFQKKDEFFTKNFEEKNMNFTLKNIRKKAFEEWEKKKIEEKEKEKKLELLRNFSLEQKKIEENQQWKQQILDKIQSQKAANPQKTKKKRKKGLKKRKSMLFLIENSPFYKEKNKTAENFMRKREEHGKKLMKESFVEIGKGKKLDYRNEDELISLLVEKYNYC